MTTIKTFKDLNEDLIKKNVVVDQKQQQQQPPENESGFQLNLISFDEALTGVSSFRDMTGKKLPDLTKPKAEEWIKSAYARGGAYIKHAYDQLRNRISCLKKFQVDDALGCDFSKVLFLPVDGAGPTWPKATNGIPEHNEKTCSTELNDLDKQVEEIWKFYPRKQGKKTALAKIKAAVKRYGYKKIQEATEAYGKARENEDPCFTPMPATWFHQERFLDDPSTWAMKPRQGTSGNKCRAADASRDKGDFENPPADFGTPNENSEF